MLHIAPGDNSKHPATRIGVAKGIKVALMVCTRNRNALLRDWLRSVKDLRVPDNTALSIVVVDNNETSQKSEFETMAKDFGLHIHYRFTQRRGYSSPRNVALRAGLALGADVLIFTDDDLTLAEDLLGAHLERLAFFSADAVHGTEAGAAHSREGRLLKKGAATYNISFKRSIAERFSFDERLNLMGREDIEFFREAADHGAIVVKSNLPKVHRNDPPAQKALKPAYHIANGRNDLVIERLRRGHLHAWRRFVSHYLRKGGPALLPALFFYLVGSIRLKQSQSSLPKLHASQIDALLLFGAVQGLFLPGVERVAAKEGRLIPLQTLE